MNDVKKDAKPAQFEAEDLPPDPQRDDWSLRLFEKSLFEQARLARLAGMLGATRGETCLALGGDGATHVHLRQLGGMWHGADITAEAVDSLRSLLSGDVEQVEPAKLPYKDGQFDRVVVIDLLERVEDQLAFVAECHRVLHASGRLIVHVPHAKRGAFLRPLKRLLGEGERPGQIYAGYTPPQLFDVLKDGFDVEDTQTYSRFFAEFSELLVRMGAGYVRGKMAAEGGEEVPDYERIHRYLSITYPVSWVISRLDALLFFTRGYYLVARARRRIWRPRRTPVLHDGRSLAEATLATKIGTATEFNG